MSTKTETSSEKPKRKYTRKPEITVPEPGSPSHDAAVQYKADADAHPYFCDPVNGPTKDIASGDKTPAYVEWFRANHTEEEFQARYGHRKHPLNTE